LDIESGEDVGNQTQRKCEVPMFLWGAGWMFVETGLMILSLQEEGLGF
jgi:hypothetical protein